MDRATHRRRKTLPAVLTAEDAPLELETPRAPLTGAELHARAQQTRAQLQQQMATIDAEIAAKRAAIESMQQALQDEAESLEQERLTVAAARADERRLATRLGLVAGTGDEDGVAAEHAAAVEQFAHLELLYNHREARIGAAKAENDAYLDGLREAITDLRKRRGECEQTDADLAAEEAAAHDRAGREALAAERAHHAQLTATLDEARSAVAAAQAALDTFYTGVPERLAAWPERIAEGVDLTPWQPSPGAEVMRRFIGVLDGMLAHPAALASVPVVNNQVSVERALLFNEDELRAMLFRADGRQLIVQHLALARNVLERLEPTEQADRARRAAAAAQ